MRSCGHATGPSPWDGAESEWVYASCAADPVDLEHVPGWSCTCGFYATKTLAPLPTTFHAVTAALAMDPPFEDGVERGWIFGRVELAGKIIEHDYGYRAQRARIVELNPLEGDERNGSTSLLSSACPSAIRFPSSRWRSFPIFHGPRQTGHLPLGSESGIGFKSRQRSLGSVVADSGREPSARGGIPISQVGQRAGVEQ
jgi:hypothetical protein